MAHVEHPHHTEVQGYICPGKARPVFVTDGHFLDRHDGMCDRGWPNEQHSPALQVIDIYVVVNDTYPPPTPQWTLSGGS